MKAFDINDEGDVNLFDIPSTTLQSVYEEMIMEPESIFKLQTFLRTKLKSTYRLSFDLVHKVFLSQNGINEQVITFKFRIMVSI